MNFGSVKNFGVDGGGRAVSAKTFTTAISAVVYFLDFNNDVVIPSTGPSNRSYGFPIRCQA